MDSRKPQLLDHFLSALCSKRRVVSGFGLGLVASLLVLSYLLSVGTPSTIPSSLFSWFSSVSDSVSHSEKTHEGNSLESSFIGGEPDLGKVHDGNLTGDAKDSSNLVSPKWFPEETHDGGSSNSSFAGGGSDVRKSTVGSRDSNNLVIPVSTVKTHDGNLSRSSFSGREPDVSKARTGNSTGDTKKSGYLLNAETFSENSHGNITGKDGSGGNSGVTVSSEKINEDNTPWSNVSTPNGGALVSGRTHSGNTSKDDNRGKVFEKKDGVDGKDHARNGVNREGKNASHGSEEGRAGERIQEDASKSNGSGSTKTMEVLSEKCNIFHGRWVMDERKPYYPSGSCPYIDADFDCHKNGRPDDGFLRWRWQPYDCNIPRLNATDFLVRLRARRLIFVGDSLNRNMWESLVCILRNSVKHKSRVYEVSGKSEFKTKGYYSFRFEDYNCSVDFVRSPFLVREIYLKNVNGSEDEKLRLDLLDETTPAYSEAEIIVFNTGHWWTHEKTSRGIDYYQEGNYVYPVLKVMQAYKKALNTWARWVDKNINPNKTRVVFRGYSLTHFRGGQWNSGGQCHKETEPIFNQSFLAKYPSKMRALEQVLEQMKTPVIYLNISRLTDFRKDGHPSIYRKTYRTVEEQIAAEKSQDCSHWCLPGIPDTWNELLYASLLMDGQGSWKR